MAITRLNDDKNNNKYNDVIDVSSDDTSMIFLKKLVEKVDEAIDLANTHITKMAANDAKTGITTEQANAITANTAKTGITSQQATDISNNKTNISTNTTNIASKLRVSTLPTVPSGVQQEVECGVVFDSKAKTYSMVFAYLETSTVRGKKQTVTRTGSIQLS